MGLADKTCTACSGEVPPVSADEIPSFLKELNGWTIFDENKLIKSYKFTNFAEALALANKIGDLAEKENHHPDLLVRWGELKIELWTHKIDNLTEADFILAAKIDRLSV